VGWHSCSLSQQTDRAISSGVIFLLVVSLIIRNIRLGLGLLDFSLFNYRRIARLQYICYVFAVSILQQMGTASGFTAIYGRKYAG